MKFYKNGKVAIFITLLMIGAILVIPHNIKAEENEQNRAIRDFDDILIFTEGNRGDDREDILDYLMHDHFPGNWCDAEKTMEDTEDDEQCWAAAASNVLEWTGWGIGVEPGIDDCDDIFQEFQDHWIDDGGFEHWGWHWWFDGSAPAGKVDLAGGGNYYSSLTWSDYFHQTWYDGRASWDGLPSDSYDLMEALDIYLHNGWGVTLGFSYHAITAWGFSYDSEVDPSDYANYYTGIYVTDSDDDKTNDPDPGNPNEADEYPDNLRYYDIEYSGGRWNVLSYYGGSSPIDSFFAFEPMDINTDPVADAGPDQSVNEGDILTFDGSGSSDPDGDPLTHSWDFDDGDTGSGVNPTHIYCDEGIYTVTLTVEDIHGGFDTDTMTVIVTNLPPVCDAGSDQTVNEGDTVYFSGSASDPGCDTLTYEWNFGDGSPITTATLTPSHVYCDEGTYTVSLEISDGDGGSDIDTLTVTVNNVAPTAIANVDYNIIDENNILNFDGSASSDPGCDTIFYHWDFGDGTTSTEEIPQHTYGDNGVFYVTLTVTDEDSESDSDMLTITVNNVAPEVGDLGYYWCDENTLRTLIAQNINDPGSDDITITWDFGDGTPTQTTIYYNNGISSDPYPSPEINPVLDLIEYTYHTYGDNGEFTVTVTITDDDGGVNTVSGTVRVDNVNPTLSDITLNLPYTENPSFILPIVHNLELCATAADQGSDDLTFIWNWGDGNTDTSIYYNDGIGADPYPSPEINPITITDTQYHTYDLPGTYTITLTVEDDDGGITTTTYEITILDIEGAKHDINNYIQDLPDNVFKGKADKRKNAFDNMFNALDDMLDDEEYWGMIQHLNNNIRSKCDGEVDGKKGDDWIKDPDVQIHICGKIDDLTAYISTYL